MTTNKDRLRYLLHRYQLKQINWEEMQELFAGINAEENETVVQQYLEEKLANPSLVDTSVSIDWDFMFRQVTMGGAFTKSPAGIRYMKRFWWAAAAILLLLGITTVWLFIRTPTVSPENASSVIAQTTIQPGQEGAVLTLSDGTLVLLDTIKNAAIALQGGAKAKIVNGVLVYEKTGDEIVYNTMSTPKGRQYQLTLPDGTKVWLNAASSIRFPTVFAGKERSVELKGEAYFEVSKDQAMPFSVRVNNKATVQVLGTSFNINAYENEPGIQTTLLDGAVLVNSGKRQQKLIPGQQARIAMDKSVNLVSDVNTEKVMAWKNGLFNFEGATLDEIMRQLERWYDIEVRYENGIPAKEFEGEMTRGITLNQFLATMKDFDIHYRLEGRVLTILP